MADFNTLDYRVEDGIAIATFNRPDKMNTFNVAMTQDLIALFDRTDGDDDVRAVVLTGSGRAFCAGGFLCLLLSPAAALLRILSASSLICLINGLLARILSPYL